MEEVKSNFTEVPRLNLARQAPGRHLPPGVFARLAESELFAEMKSRFGSDTVPVWELESVLVTPESPAGEVVPAPAGESRNAPTDVERYAQREARSPEAQDYAGGEVVIGISLDVASSISSPVDHWPRGIRAPPLGGELSADR